MRNQKQKIYITLIVGVTIFLSILSILLISLFNSQSNKEYAIEDIEIANISVNSVDVFWKGFSDDDGFRVLYKEKSSTGAYKEITTENVYLDSIYTEGFLFNTPLNNLNSSTEYVLEIWDGDLRIFEDEFITRDVADQVDLPSPISGESFMGDWMIISDNLNTYIIRADFEGRWSIDKNLLNDNYTVEIYSSSTVLEDNPIESFLIGSVSASEEANCDQITYSGVESAVKSSASAVQSALSRNASDTQYQTCYQDVYCESQKAGVNPRWALAIWMNESNASSYSLTGADFGGTCCAPDYNFQAQLGFFLSLSQDPCGCGSGCSKEEYYCCWANNYYYGTKSKTCDSVSKAYIQSVSFYYFLTTNSILPSDFDTLLSKLPKPIKSTGNSNISCGATNPIEVYNNGGDVPDNGDDNDNSNTGGICCALKISNKDDFTGDYESTSSKTCSQIWIEGKSVYGGTLQYSVELSSINDRSSCEKTWSGVCCEDSGELEWVPSTTCSNKVTEYDTYSQCINASGKETTVTIDLEKGYNFIGLNASDSSNPLLASKVLENSSIILVASFKDGEWNNIMYREDGEIKGSDFELTKGNGYLLTTTSDIEFTYSGKSLVNYEWGTSTGWQFVSTGVLEPYSYTKSIVLSFDEVDINQIALWDQDLGRFVYYIYDLQGDEYGDSVKIGNTQGVFVKID
ncbi:MAG: hypothetical protein PHP08_03430 [Candidatus Dojkabacteria bacterium]|nr:hypothetical protein [Candidatus Dojkabacteria bacterium]